MTDKDLLEQFQILHGMFDQMSGQLSKMATKEDLDAFKREVRAEFKSVDKRFDDVDIHFRGLESRMDSMEDSIISKIVTEDDIERIADRAASKAIMVAENTFGKRIDALNDGYKLTHEKQWELEHRMDKLEQGLEDLKNRIA